MAVNLVTFDGTGSLAPTNYEISEAMDPNPSLTVRQRNLGGGFPANVAVRLAADQPNLWRWWPVDYRPGFNLQQAFNPTAPYDWPFRTGSMGRAVAQFGAILPQMSGKIVLCGLSQGAWICDLLWEEFNNPAGLFYSRRSDVVGVVTFGSPPRPFGRTIPTLGAISPTGQGVAIFEHTLSFGTVPTLGVSPHENTWAFCQLDDAASDNDRTGQMAAAQQALAEFIYDGDVDSGIPLVFQMPTLLAGVLGAFGTEAWNTLIKPTVDTRYSIGKWIPFLSGSAAKLDEVVSPTNDPRAGNPHAAYNSSAYDALITAPAVSTQLQGDWNPVTNTPSLSNSSGSNGHSYRVSVAGSRNLGSGTISFAAKDIIVKTGGVWVKATKNTKTAVDLAVEHLKTIGATYADSVTTTPAQLGYTWWQSPPNT